MVNDLRGLLHDSSDNPPPSTAFDSDAVIRSGRSRVRRRRAAVVGAAGLLAAAVVVTSTFALNQDPKADPATPPGKVTDPIGQVLTLSDATSVDLTPIYESVLDLADFDNSRLIDGVTDDGQAVVRDDATSETTLSNLSLVDLASGAEEPLPDVAGTDGAQAATGTISNYRLIEATDERLVYVSLRTTVATRNSKVGVSILDRSSATWSRLSWPSLPAGKLLGLGVGADDRMYVALNSDASNIEDSVGMTGTLWSVSLSDASDVRDEDRVVGAIAVDDNHLVWSEASQGVSNQLTVRDLDTGDETSFDPRSGAYCTQTGLGVDADRIVMSQTCVVEAGASDDRIQVVSLTGEPVATVQDTAITGYADRGGHAIITAAGPDNAGVYSYDLATGDLLRLSTTNPGSTLPRPGPVRDGYLVWFEGKQGGSTLVQKIAEAP